MRGLDLVVITLGVLVVIVPWWIGTLRIIEWALFGL